MFDNAVANSEGKALRSRHGPTLAGRVVQRVMTNSFGIAKVVLDFCFAVVLLILTAPIMLLTALAVKLTSRGPVFYSQVRLGRGGLPYRIYKIRTMYHNC